MEETKRIAEFIKSMTTAELWTELGRRFNVKYGKIQMAFHGGLPSEFADLDVRVKIAQSEAPMRARGATAS